MTDFIKRTAIALLLAGLALPVAASERHKESEEEAESRSRSEEVRIRRELERELREARRAFQSAARKMQSLQARLMAQEARDRARRDRDRERTIRSTVRIMSRARLGVVVDPSEEDRREGPGARIVAVTPGSPAEAAGLQPGDVVITMNGVVLDGEGQAVHAENAAAEMIRRARSLEPGDTVTLTVRRDGTSQEITLQAEASEFRPRWIPWHGEFPSVSTEIWPYALLEYEGPDDETRRRWRDFELVALTPELGKYFGSDKGVLVIRTPEDPLLDVKVGDVITRISGEFLTTPMDAVRTLLSIEPGQKVDVRLLRDRKELTVQAVVPTILPIHVRPPEEEKD